MLQVAHLIPDGIELFVVGPGHEDVDVVVPGDEALVAHGTDEGAAAHPVAEVVFLTDLLEILEDFQGFFLQCAGGHIAGDDSCFVIDHNTLPANRPWHALQARGGNFVGYQWPRTAKTVRNMVLMSERKLNSFSSSRL